MAKMKYIMRNIQILCSVATLFLRTEGHPVGSCRELTHQDAPANGGLVCLTFLQHKFCAVRCDEGFNVAKPARHFDFCGPDTGYRWTHQYVNSSAKINQCVPEIYRGFHLEEEIFFLPGVCDQLSTEAENTVVEAFSQKIVPEELQGSRYRGELICPETTSMQCPDLTSAEAPDNGALVCYTDQNNKYCAKRCNDGYDFVLSVNDFEFCRPSTNFSWTFDIEQEDPCVEEFFPGLRLAADVFYLPQSCSQLTPEDQNKIKEDFKQVLEVNDVYPPSADEISITCGENTG